MINFESERGGGQVFEFIAWFVKSKLMNITNSYEFGSSEFDDEIELFRCVWSCIRCGNYDKAIEVYKFLIDNNKTKLADARLYGFNNRKKFVGDSLDFKIYNTKINTSFNEFNGVLYQNGLMYESNQFESKFHKKKFFLWNWLSLKKSNFAPEFAWDGAGFKKLYILGKKDPVLSVEEALEEAKEIQAESVILSGGHMSHIENTNELLIALQKFVKQC